MYKYCTSLELSKELYKRGIVKDAEFWWCRYTHNPKDNVYLVSKDELSMDLRNSKMIAIDKIYERLCPAPIAEELLEIMPWKFKTKDGLWIRYEICRDIDEYIVSYEVSNIGGIIKIIKDSKLSDALAKMLIWLDDNDYLEK